MTNRVEVNLDCEGQSPFGAVTDMGEACTRSWTEHDGDRVLALDFGLSTLFTPAQGSCLDRTGSSA